MNIFLDTTVFYDDPFLKKPHIKNLIKICKQNNFTIFVSNIVLLETSRHYENKIISHFNNYIKAKNFLETDTSIYFLDKEIDLEYTFKKSLERFNDYYQNHEQIKILEYDNEILPELVHRSIHRIKPFSENKQEFRDAIIWLTYSKFAEKHHLEECFFITNNSSDYLYKGSLHKDLQNDTQRINIYQQPYGLLYSDNLKSYLETDKEFEQFKTNWFELPIKERVSILKPYLYSDEVLFAVNQYVKDYIESSNFSELYLRELFSNNSNEGTSKFKSITKYLIENNSEKFFLNNGITQINGTLNVTSLTEKNSIPDNDITEDEVSLELYFSCTFNTVTYDMSEFNINSHYNLKNIDEELQFMNYSNHL